METVNGYPQRVSRRVTELNAEQKKLFDAFVATVKQIRDGEVRYPELLVECANAEVPIAHLAKAAGVHRKTIYDQLQRARKTDGEPTTE